MARQWAERRMSDGSRPQVRMVGRDERERIAAGRVESLQGLGHGGETPGRTHMFRRLDFGGSIGHSASPRRAGGVFGQRLGRLCRHDAPGQAALDQHEVLHAIADGPGGGIRLDQSVVFRDSGNRIAQCAAAFQQRGVEFVERLRRH